MAAPGSRASRRFPLLLVAAAVVVAIAGATAVYMRVAGEESIDLPESSTYTEGVTGTWQRVNPLFSTENAVDQDLASLVFSGLLQVAPDGQILPDLAADLPQVSADGRTYTFTLRDDVRWHDGEPFTSRDVVFTIESILAPGFRGDQSLPSLWDSVEVSAPDFTTVVFRLPEPSAPFLARNATLGILPSHLLEEHSADRLFESAFNVAPVGTGPYVMSMLTATEATFLAYGDYHHGRPRIDNLRIRFYPDYSEAIRAVELGDIDGLMLRNPPTEAQRAEIEGLSDVVIQTPQRAAHLVLYLNNDAAAFFQDERVRQAFALAINRDEIVREIYGDAATPSSSPVAPGSWAYDAEYEVPVADALDEARELLDAAGWESHPTTGIRVRLGSEFRITIRTDNDPLRLAVAQMVAQQLEPLGVRATVASTSFAVLRRDFLQERRYEAAIAGWDQGTDPDPYFAWHSSQMGTAGLNIANYSDPIGDRLIEEARRRSSHEVRVDMYRQFQEIWDRSAPSVVIAYPRYTYIQSPSIESFVSDFLPAAHLRFVRIHEWRRS